jgi:DNA mismatch repair ATPase MutS
MDMEFLHVEKKIEKQLNVLTELNTARSAVISLRDSLNDSLSSCPDASYIVRRMEANKAISVQATRTAVFSRDGFKCQKCHATKDLSIDHIVSVKNGGGDDLDNLQTLCTRCNSAKGAL